MATQDDFNNALGRAIAERWRRYDAEQAKPLADLVGEPMYSDIIQPYLAGLIGAIAEGAVQGTFAFFGELSGGLPLQVQVRVEPQQQ